MSGLPLVLLAEPPATSSLWDDVVTRLAGGHRCVRLELIPSAGIGGPTRRHSYAIDAQSRIVRRQLDALGLERVGIVAGGLAGAVAVDVAARFPERVAALALMGAPLHPDAWPPAAVLPLLVRGAGEALLAFCRRDPGRARRLVARLLSTPDGADLQPFADALRQPDAARILLRLVRSVDMATVDASRQLVAEAPPPCMVLWGESDAQLSPEYGRRVASELRASFDVILNAGHLVMREQPERVAAALSHFLRHPLGRL